MAVVGLMVHPERPEAGGKALELSQWLDALGHDVRMPEADAAAIGAESLACPDDKIADGLDLAVSLGGDGSILRVVALVSDCDVPVLGVNFGHLGYLTEVEPGGAQDAIERCLDGDHVIEERMRVRTEIEAPDSTSHGLVARALNEAVVEKVQSGRTIHLEVTIDGDFFTTYAADGFIVASPTGSTAYSLSARGPIVAPTHHALILTPVSPHMLFDRSLVIEPTSEVRVELVSDRPAAVALDGNTVADLQPGDAVTCTASAHSARLVRLGGRNFHHVLKSKFGLNDR